MEQVRHESLGKLHTVAQPAGDFCSTRRGREIYGTDERGEEGVFGTRKRSRQEGVHVTKLESNFSVTVKKLENRGSDRKKPKKKQRTSGGICRTTDCFAL